MRFTSAIHANWHDGRGDTAAFAPRLVGRDEEQQALDRLLADAADGLSGVLVLRGEPGMGKTALLDHAVRSGREVEVAAVAGVEAEMELGYAALHRLLVPHLDRRNDLPGPQADALGAAFGLVSGPPPDRFLVGLATLTLLAEVAEPRPLLCVVDDAHWLDQESLEVLGFVGRRLFAESIALVFAVRTSLEDRTNLGDLPTITLAGLSPSAAATLLATTATGEVDLEVSRRIVAETLGNPLALIELAQELSADQLGGEALLPEPLPLGPRLEARYLRDVRALPPEAQSLLLVAAVDASRDPDLVSRAAARLGVGVGGSAATEANDLITLRPHIRFRHPLVRSAVISGASPEEQRQAHAALAAEIDSARDPDRHAWHLAGAVVATDEAVAAVLERAADRARARGGSAATGALLVRAARISPSGASRGRRLLAATDAYLAAGDATTARLLLDEADTDLDDPLLQAHALRLGGAIRLATGRIPETPSILLEAALALEPYDVRLARDTLLAASSAAIFGGRSARTAVMAEVADAAAAVPLPPGAPPTSGDLLLDGFAALFTRGHRAGAPLLRRAVEDLDGDEPVGDDALGWLGFGCWAAGALADNEALRRLSSRLVQAGRDRGALVAVTRGLYFLAMGDLIAGDLVQAGAHFAEDRELIAARGGGTGLGQVIALAWRGEESATRQEAASVAQAAGERGQGGVAVYTDHALAVLELGLGHYQAAFEAAERVDQENSYFLSTIALPDLVEAGVRSGHGEVAARALARCRDRAEVNATPLALGLAARAGALLASDDEAEQLHRSAIDHLSSVPALGHLARARLLYGEWLRRRNRRVDARAQLHPAHDAFDAIGAKGFAERARVELLATGEKARKRTVDTARDLTPQELRIAQLAAQRATNGEIAAQLFISPGTVDYHLRKVFRKLDITSRRQLPDALAPTPGTD